MKCLALILILLSAVYADQVIWDYSLSTLPPGWEVFEGEWTFEPDGAHSDASAGLYEIDWNELRSVQLVLPEGTDSISISASQNSLTWETALPGTFSFARMALQINDQGFISWNNSAGADTLPIFVIPPGAAAGDTVRVDLLCSAVCWPDPAPDVLEKQVQATADFHIWDFVLTAYGDITALTPSTWGSIKALPGVYLFRNPPLSDGRAVPE